MSSKEFFNSIQFHYSGNLPFVAYRKPDETVLNALLQNDEKLYLTNDYSESGFVFAAFDNRNPSVLIPLSDAILISSKSDEFDRNLTSKKIGEEDVSQEKLHHIKLVEKGIHAIKANEFQKVVLSRNQLVTLDDANPIRIFQNLLNSYASAFVYCWFHPQVGLWLGATPETLLTIDGRTLTTMALAGTQKFKGSIDVEWQNKEKDEQQYVTDFIVDSLQPSVENCSVSEVETVKAGNLLHLITKISANIKPLTFNLKNLLKAIHPTPAVCGLPKENAKQFILKNETYSREYYTGFMGELNFKEKISRNSNRHNVENNAYVAVKTVSNLYVNLRCMQLKDNQAILYIGGGITKDSIPENEWEETVAKSQVIKSVL